MAERKLILCVRESKKGQKTVTIPINEDIIAGDYVEVRKLIF